MIQRIKIVKNEAQNYALEKREERKKTYTESNRRRERGYALNRLNYFRVNDGREGWTTVGSSIEGLAKNERNVSVCINR
jgi:hypothetical protein